MLDTGQTIAADTESRKYNVKQTPAVSRLDVLRQERWKNDEDTARLDRAIDILQRHPEFEELIELQTLIGRY